VVADKFSAEWQVANQLATCCSLLGEEKAAIKWLGHAIDTVGKLDIRMKALEDDDLQSMWTTISEI
jgi:hypothetical protein